MNLNQEWTAAAPGPQMLARQLDERLDAAPARDLRAYLLLDHSAIDSLAECLGSGPWAWRSLLGTDPATLRAAPLLVDLGAPTRAASNQPALAWICSRAAYSNSLSLLLSPLPHEMLATRLGMRLEVKTGDGLSLLFRFADTRILDSALTILGPEQRAAFLGLARAWWFCDRAASLHDAGAAFHAHDRWSAPLCLTDAQYAAFMDAALPDEVASLMPPEHLVRAKLDPLSLHDVLRRAIAQARLWRIVESPDVAVFASLVLKLGPQFDQTPPWQSALQDVADGRCTLEEALVALSAGPHF